MKVAFHSKFNKDLDKLKNASTKKAVEELIVALEQAKILKDIVGLKKMKGASDAYRIRLGDYRVCFFFENQTINLARVLPRKDVYKYFPK